MLNHWWLSRAISSLSNTTLILSLLLYGPTHSSLYLSIHFAEGIYWTLHIWLIPLDVRTIFHEFWIFLLNRLSVAMVDFHFVLDPKFVSIDVFEDVDEDIHIWMLQAKKGVYLFIYICCFAMNKSIQCINLEICWVHSH